MRNFIFILLLALAACSNNSDPHSLKGVWTIDKELSAAPIVGLSNEEADALIGQPLTINAEKIEFQNKSCVYESIRDNKQTVAEFLQFYSLDSGTKFPENTIVLNLDCEGDMAIEHLLTNKDTLWLVWYGVLLETSKN